MKKWLAVVLTASMLFSLPVYAEESVSETLVEEILPIETEVSTEGTEPETVLDTMIETDSVEETVTVETQIEMEEVLETETLEEAKEDGVTAFVKRLYTKVLNRKPDNVGLNDWVSKLKNRTKTGAEVAQGFICSKELEKRKLSNSAYVEMLYQTFFDRSSDKTGKQYWMKQLEDGMSRNYVFRGFANSAEFQKICNSYNITRGTIVLSDPCDQNEGITKFVYRCYKKFLGRTADYAGLNDWCNRLLTKKINAKQAAEGFVMSREFASMNLNYYSYVETMYWGLFDRKADKVGLESWVNKLMSGFEYIDIFNGFADSQEFRKLAASFGLANNWQSVPFCYLVDNGIYTLEFPLSWAGRFNEAGSIGMGFDYTCYYNMEIWELDLPYYVDQNEASIICYVYFVDSLDEIAVADYDVLGYSDRFDFYAVAVYDTDVPFEMDNNIAIWHFNMKNNIQYVFKSINFH